MDWNGMKQLKKIDSMNHGEQVLSFQDQWLTPSADEIPGMPVGCG